MTLKNLLVLENEEGLKKQNNLSMLMDTRASWKNSCWPKLEKFERENNSIGLPKKYINILKSIAIEINDDINKWRRDRKVLHNLCIYSCLKDMEHNSLSPLSMGCLVTSKDYSVEGDWETSQLGILQMLSYSDDPG